jgi:hypothetical protein
MPASNVGTCVICPSRLSELNDGAFRLNHTDGYPTTVCSAQNQKKPADLSVAG